MDNNIELSLDSLNDVEMVELNVKGGCCYACCGNCRYYDGDDWCGYHRTHTTGGDHCDSWEE